MRNCLNQLITSPSVASAMFEYRFTGSGELAGHNLGNLMLKALDHLSVRPLEAINLIRGLLKVDAVLIPMSEHPVDLVATDTGGNQIYGEVQIDNLNALPHELQLHPVVKATQEAINAIDQADVILIGPGSFLTSLMPLLLLLLDDLARALRRTPAQMVYIGNLGRELNQAAAHMTLTQKLAMIENKVGRKVVDAVIVSPHTSVQGINYRLIVQQPLSAPDVPHHHDRELLRQALEITLQRLG